MLSIQITFLGITQTVACRDLLNIMSLGYENILISVFVLAKNEALYLYVQNSRIYRKPDNALYSHIFRENNKILQKCMLTCAYNREKVHFSTYMNDVLLNYIRSNVHGTRTCQNMYHLVRVVV